MKISEHKIFNFVTPTSAINVASDWLGHDHVNWQFTDDYTEALAQPCKIAMMPALFNCPGSYTYREKFKKYDFSKFDLVVLSDIECHSQDYIIEECIQPAGIKNYLVAAGGVTTELTDPDFIYRPWWMFHHRNLNSIQVSSYNKREFLFDALLGSRKLHRSYVMARLQQRPDLLSNSIVNYRDTFINHWGDNPKYLYDHVRKTLDGKELLWPYVSKNFTEEQPQDLEPHQISEVTPWDIYEKTHYSICCESFGNNPDDTNPGPFFLTEKTAKMFMAQRMFIMFAPQHTLRFIKSLGFETFDSVIDESYDDIADPRKRFDRAFDQVEYLAKQDPAGVYEKVMFITQYNFFMFMDLIKKTKEAMLNKLLQKIDNIE